jgi:hypothetical protein
MRASPRGYENVSTNFAGRTFLAGKERSGSILAERLSIRGRRRIDRRLPAPDGPAFERERSARIEAAIRRQYRFEPQYGWIEQQSPPIIIRESRRAGRFRINFPAGDDQNGIALS